MKIGDIYANGQIISELVDQTLTYYHTDGSIKAQGMCTNGRFQGKWIFNRKEGILWQVGHFKDNQKDGEWTRYKKDGSVEKKQYFEKGKEVKN